MKSSHSLWQKRLNKQMIVSVNILGHVQLKGNLEKKMALIKLEDIVHQEDAKTKEFSDYFFLCKTIFCCVKKFCWNCFVILKKSYEQNLWWKKIKCDKSQKPRLFHKHFYFVYWYYPLVSISDHFPPNIYNIFAPKP